jgi:MraZ protein
MQFVGTYYHTVEDQGRISVPKSFRNGLGEGSVVTKGLDGCLFIFGPEEWGKLTSKLEGLPLGQRTGRDFLRLITYNAAPLECDALGRARFPVPLTDSVNIKKDVVFVGTLSRIEVWDKATYHKYFDELASRETELSESLGEIGI